MNVASLAGSDIALRFAQITEIGGRATNQDALGKAQQDDLACYVVSDGAGGHEGGEIASHLVVNAIIDSFMRDTSFGVRALRYYLDSAIERVALHKDQEERLKDMSATVAVVLIDQKNRAMLCAHMGDTRVYFFRRSKLQKVTEDHSLVQQFIDAGFWKPELLRDHPQRSTLFAAIGAEGETQPEVTDVSQVEDGDTFLICTDGFWEWVSEGQVERTLIAATTADEWLFSMRAIADNNSALSPKSRDNYTAYTLWLGEPEVVTIIQSADEPISQHKQQH